MITVGGIGTIAAVTLILVYLVSVVVPLFRGAEVSEPATTALADPPPDGVIAVSIDEYASLAGVLGADGRLRVLALDGGGLLEDRAALEAPPVAWSSLALDGGFACAFPDGTLRTGRLAFATDFPSEEELPEEARALAPGGRLVLGEHIVERTASGLRRLAPVFELGAPIEFARAREVRALASLATGDRTLFALWTETGELLRLDVERTTDFLTGEERVDVVENALPTRPDFAGDAREPPPRLFFAGIGESVLVLWSDGRMERIDARVPAGGRLAEVIDLVPGDGRLTSTALLTGNKTLIVGSSDGRLSAWFGTKPAGADTTDGILFQRAHELEAEAGPAVRAIAPSGRSRLVAAAFDDGSVRLYQVTSGQRLARAEAPPGPVLALRLAPREDELLALGSAGWTRWKVDAGYPEAGLRIFFGPVWYESYPRPEHVWQSSSGTDDSEPKLGFVPLVFGTLKATFYSMLFAVPLALLAAVATSEFLDRRLRVPVKSTIELMASLPSVVLGYLAGIVIAPFAQSILPATLAVLVTVPLALLLGAYLWQCLPQRIALRGSGLPKLGAVLIALVAGVVAALGIGPALERLLFAGDLELWLDGQAGRALGGWLLFVFPLSVVIVVLGPARWFDDRVRARAAGWGRGRRAATDLARFVAATAASLALAFGLALALEKAGFDPRGTVFDTYVQRNALVVGFVMGFAVIPILYTLAEDALSSVPQHLRLASLAAGATTWQTALRVVVPAAMSGLFSAVMVGLGRAVGETMIVLMATGNTPVMSLNPFDGFRTLSANVAVELPEAVKGSTHYRALFLAAIVLFALTFVLNTVAEGVRLRFRKRAREL
jgi:phosphate transport system permease protein